MLNREKIRMMAGLTMYAKHGGAEELKTAEHYRYDYIMTQLFSAFIRFTACFSVCLVLYMIVRSNDIFYRINAEGFISTVKGYLLIYAAGLAVYLGIAFAVYFIKHSRAVKNTELYASGLRRLLRKTQAKEKDRR